MNNNHFDFEQPEELSCRLALIEKDNVWVWIKPHLVIKFISALYIDAPFMWQGAFFSTGTPDELRDELTAGVFTEQDLRRHKIFKIHPLEAPGVTYFIVARRAQICKRVRTQRVLFF